MGKHLVRKGESLWQLAGGDSSRYQRLIDANGSHPNIAHRAHDDEYFGYLDVGECIDIPWQSLDDQECGGSPILRQLPVNLPDQRVTGPIDCQHCYLHFQVVDQVTGDPIPGATVAIVFDARREVADQQGNVRFDELADRVYTITVTASGYTARTASCPSVCCQSQLPQKIALTKEEDVLVTAVTGPAEVALKETATYRVTAYNRATVSAQQKQRIKWRVEYVKSADGTNEEVIASEDTSSPSGDTLDLVVPRNCAYLGCRVRVYPYFKKAIRSVSAVTAIYCLPEVHEIDSLEKALLPGTKDAIYRFQGCVYVVAFRNPTAMTPFTRTAEELFEDTVQRQARESGLCAIINGVYYGVTNSGKIDAAFGDDPVAASETTIEGRVVTDAATAGTSAPSMFYLQESGGNYTSGFGDPPGVGNAFGGAGPLIIASLPYGDSNQYLGSVPAGAPLQGPPGSKFAPFLVRRSNLTYQSLIHDKGEATGKTILAFRTRDKLLALIVQEDGKCNLHLDTIRDALVTAGFDHAVFVDGSDSAMLFARNRFLLRQGSLKNETNTMGIGIKCR